MAVVPLLSVIPMRLYCLFLAGLTVAQPLDAQQSDSTTLASYRQARAVLDSALAAHGGETRLRALRSIQLRYEGTSHWRNQSPSAKPPWATTPASGRVVLDFAGERSLLDTRSEFPGGFHNHSRHLFAAAGSWTANYILQTWFFRNDSTGVMRRGLNRMIVKDERQPGIRRERFPAGARCQPDLSNSEESEGNGVEGSRGGRKADEQLGMKPESRKPRHRHDREDAEEREHHPLTNHRRGDDASVRFPVHYVPHA